MPTAISRNLIALLLQDRRKFVRVAIASVSRYLNALGTASVLLLAAGRNSIAVALRFAKVAEFISFSMTAAHGA